jgi:pyruvate kinase
VPCIIVLSKSGRTAINIAKYRPDVPIVTFVPSAKIGRLLQVMW